MKRPLLAFVAGILPAFILMLSVQTSSAGSATWKTSPATGDWNTASNWTPSTIPNGPSDTATFDFSNKTGVSLSANTEVKSILFDANASAFTITANPTVVLLISGTGITNNSEVTQNFMSAGDGVGNRGTIAFTGSATAGVGTVFTNNASTVSGGGSGTTDFHDSSTAGNGTFTNAGSMVGSAGGGRTQFHDTSSAGDGTFTTNGGAAIGALGGFMLFDGNSTAGNGYFTNNGSTVTGGYGAQTSFFGTSTAGNGTVINSGTIFFGSESTAGDGQFTTNSGAFNGAVGGQIAIFNFASGGNGTFIVNGSAFTGANVAAIVDFQEDATASNATLIANGGVSGGVGGRIFFSGESDGGTARVAVFGNGNLAISLLDAPGVTVGSIEGNGDVFLGSKNLTVGSNNLSTSFSGVIQDGGPNGGTGGSLTKVGAGTLTLKKASTYTGGTIINRGKLVINNTSGFGTGSGAVHINAGRLGGTGRIAGDVTVGTASGPGAILSPGQNPIKPGTLTTRGALTFNSDATYNFGLKAGTGIADKVVAHRVTINSGALFSFVALGSGTLSAGTVFIAIDNTAVAPITGRFNNLPDGSTFSSNGNNFKVNYQGGDGNDLTLTVVP